LDNKQIETALKRIFHDENARVVFWNDPGREFQNDVPFLNLGDVNLVRLDETGFLEVKCRVEKGDPEGKYLLYSPEEEPDYGDDWLLDIRLYSRSFRADRASMLVDALGLSQQRMRAHLALRRKFFDNRERLEKLQALVAANDDEQALDRKMIAVVCRAEQPEPFIILRTLFHAMAQEGGLESVPPGWEQVEKYDLDTPFWDMVYDNFGYKEETPSLKNLLLRMLASEFNGKIRGDKPEKLSNLLLPKTGTQNALVFLAQWRDSSSTAASYDLLSMEAAEALGTTGIACDLELDNLLEVMTFEDVEKVIARGIRDRVRDTADTMDVKTICEMVRRRQDGHWASPKASGSERIPRAAIHGAYSALVAAAEFFSLRNKYKDEFPFADTKELYGLYVNELFRFDQLYRHFCEQADLAEDAGWDLLKPLRDDIEAAYCHWYLVRLGIDWGKCLDSGLLEHWCIEGVPNQHGFYKRHVLPQININDRTRVFVVISDAFRFEAAQELCMHLNGEYRLQAELETQLGVVPSYTSLGMASLLPGSTLAYGKNGDVLLDGKPTASLEQRNTLLETVEGMAIKADDLLGLTKEEGRQHISGKRVVYVYHNTIDAVGDSASTETGTFAAVRTAINELANLIRFIINYLNGNHIIITADHGFLFSESAPTEMDKSKLDTKPVGASMSKKRYVLGEELGSYEGAFHGKTKDTASTEDSMEFLIPKGVSRFHFAGGARFVHGGAMLQEIVVPVITVKHVKDKSGRKDTKSKPVSVTILGTSHRITTPRHRFQLLQVEAVSERVKPVTLKVAVYEGDIPVTNIETVTFESASDRMSERQKDIYLVLQDRHYDKATPYRLSLRDADTGIEQQQVTITIDRAISDDF
jgi:uncharacterized protein (TIGR02687 family)